METILGVLQSFRGWRYHCYRWDLNYLREQTLELGAMISTLSVSSCGKEVIQENKVYSHRIPSSQNGLFFLDAFDSLTSFYLSLVDPSDLSQCSLSHSLPLPLSSDVDYKFRGKQVFWPLDSSWSVMRVEGSRPCEIPGSRCGMSWTAGSEPPGTLSVDNRRKGCSVCGQAHPGQVHSTISRQASPDRGHSSYVRDKSTKVGTRRRQKV